VALASDRHRRVDLSALQPVLETALDAVIVMSADGAVLDWNGHAEEVFGWSREEALGRPLAGLIIPESCRAAHWAGLKRLVETGEARLLDRRVELSGLTRDGQEIPVELAISKWEDKSGIVFVGFLRDLSQARAAAGALRWSEQRLRATQENAQVGIAETGRDGAYLNVNAALCAICGYGREELVGRKTLFDLTHPDDLADERLAYARQVAGSDAPYTQEKRTVRKDGEVIWTNVTASAVFDEGRFLYGIRIVQDITQRKLAEARQELLLNELNHRVKNILALVSALATQTGRFTSDIDTFTSVFEERLKALAKSHDLLIRTQWRGAEMREVLTTELEPHMRPAGAAPAVVLDGPPVQLDARTAVGLSLAAHELATNAVKYGALSAPSGTVQVSWRWVEEADRRALRLTWTERGGPPVGEPSRQGFGSKLIERLATGDLGGDVAFDYRPEGLTAAFTIVPESAS
jgi:PAS domain S-box-containing protein